MGPLLADSLRGSWGSLPGSSLACKLFQAPCALQGAHHPGSLEKLSACRGSLGLLGKQEGWTEMRNSVTLGAFPKGS